jgi:hypothetical protein
MKKFFPSIVAVVFIVGLMGLSGSDLLGPRASIAADQGPVVTLGTPLVKMAGKKTAGVVIMGTGFKPGQEIRIVFTTKEGSQSDMGDLLKPEPKADETGTWSTTWSAARYVRGELVDPKGGAYKIMVTDEDYNPIAHTPVFFQAPKKESEKK